MFESGVQYVDIELGMKADGSSYGYQIHYYDYLAKDPSNVYQGADDPVFGFKDDDAAFEAAQKSLNKRYGKKGWSC